jgi:hypothetical protein
MQYTEERLLELSRQHHMDGGGYSFDNCSLEPFKSLGCVVWEDPSYDYFIGETPAEAKGETSVLFFRPNKYDLAWPESYPGPEGWGGRMVRVQTGEIYPGNTDCDCFGKRLDDGAWDFTGNTMDDAKPDCPFCAGLGEYEREGGEYAVYVFKADA